MGPKKIQEWSRSYGLESGPGVQAKKRIKPQTLCEDEKSDHVCENNYMAMHRPGATGPTGWMVRCRRRRGSFLEGGDQ